MSFEVSDARIVYLDFDPEGRQATAKVEMDFVFDDDGADIPGHIQRKVRVGMRRDAPKRRIKKRLISKAVQEQEAYFEGEEKGSENLFHDLSDPSLPLVRNG